VNYFPRFFVQNKSGNLTDKFLKQNIPLIVFVELANRCNLKCLHCMRSNNGVETLSKTIFQSLISDLARRGTFELVLTGGEPMTHPHFFDFLDRAKARQFKITVNTNGTLITPETVRALKRFAPLTVHISLYGATALVHDGITRIGGSFEKARAAIRLLKKTGHKICVHMPVLKENFDDFEAIRDWAESSGLEFTSEFVLYPGENNSAEPLRHRVTDAQLQKAFDKLFLSTADFCADMQADKRRGESRDLATYSCRVSSAGQVFPSGTVRYELGNLNDRSFSDIWSGSAARELRALEDSDFDCYGCKRFGRCQPDIGLAFAEHGRLTAVPKEWCRFMGFERLTS
jgi:MoaA/NifB/PqqE/SkfB family radical SAM enzyme